MTLLPALNWRYATKRFDPNKKVSAENIEQIQRAIDLAPSSFGLQPYRALVIDDPDTREKLRAASYAQPQITECSHLFVLAAKKDMSPDYVDEYMRRIATTRGQELEDVSGFGEYIKGSTGKMSPEAIVQWNKRQTYIALGMLLAAAAELRVDSCPMEGFEAEKYDELLGLKERGLTATVVAAVGYRSEEDATRHHGKVRLGVGELFL